jgi:quercetin dioxygenase-like cupin family protein
MPSAAIMRRDEAEALNVLGVEVRFMCPAETTGKAFSLMENLIPKDAGPPPHTHDWDEAYYVISGAVDFEIAGERVQVRAGDFAYAPAGTVHAFKGATDTPARMLVFDAPAHAETFFKAVDRQVRQPADFPKVPAIGAEHGIHFVAPAAAEA